MYIQCIYNKCVDCQALLGIAVMNIIEIVLVLMGYTF